MPPESTVLNSEPFTSVWNALCDRILSYFLSKFSLRGTCLYYFFLLQRIGHYACYGLLKRPSSDSTFSRSICNLYSKIFRMKIYSINKHGYNLIMLVCRIVKHRGSQYGSNKTLLTLFYYIWNEK